MRCIEDCCHRYYLCHQVGFLILLHSEQLSNGRETRLQNNTLLPVRFRVRDNSLESLYLLSTTTAITKQRIGLCWAVTVTPFELVKCRAQRNNTTSTVEFKRIIEEKNRNPLKVLNSVYRGIPISFVRDCIGIGVWYDVISLSNISIFFEQQQQQTTNNG